MTTTQSRTLAKVAVASGILGFVILACSLATGHLSPLQPIDALINLVEICLALWILNQPK